MYRSDKPIDCKDKDLFNRGGFARTYAKVILAYDNSEPLVVGLYGDWGQGKTSILNMIVDEIGSAAVETPSPIILHFRPWNYTDANQLLQQFFMLLAKELLKIKDDKLETVGSLLKSYGQCFEWLPIPYGWIKIRIGMQYLIYNGFRLMIGIRNTCRMRYE